MKPLKHWVVAGDVPMIMVHVAECGTLHKLPGLSHAMGPTATPTAVPTDIPTMAVLPPSPVPTAVPTKATSHCCVCGDGSLVDSSAVILHPWLQKGKETRKCNIQGCGMAVTIHGYGKCSGNAPTRLPTAVPTSSTPTAAPTAAPSSDVPTAVPTKAPTLPTSSPTGAPSAAPTSLPTSRPSSNLAVTTDCCDCDDGTHVSATIDIDLNPSCPDECSKLIQFHGDVACEKRNSKESTPSHMQNQICILLPCATGCPRAQDPSCNSGSAKLKGGKRQ